MELVSTTAPTNAFAKCLSSVKVEVASNCDVTLTATAAGGNFVPSMWTPAAADTYSYKQYKECPVAGTAVVGVDAAANLATAFANHIYGSTKAITTSLVYLAGKVTASADSQTFTYIISELTAVGADLGDAINIVVLSNGTAAGLTSGTEFNNDITATCTASEGRYGFILNDNIKVCALCPAGTTGDGYGCTACAAGTGKASGVGATTCAACDAGTYAAEGSSDCLPCPQHTFSAAQAGQCTSW